MHFLWLTAQALKSDCFHFPTSHLHSPRLPRLAPQTTPDSWNSNFCASVIFSLFQTSGSWSKVIWKLALSITLCDGRYLPRPNETAAFRSFFFFQRCLALKRLQLRTLTVQPLPPTAAWLSCHPTNWFCCSQSRLVKQNALSLFNCQCTPSHCKCLTLFWRSQGRPSKFSKIYPKSLFLTTCNLGWLQASL